MMQGKWVTFFLIVWLIGIWWGNTYNGYNTANLWNNGGYAEAPQTTISNMTGGSVSTQNLPLVGAISFINGAVGLMKSVWSACLWRFAFLKPFPLIDNLALCFGAMGVFSLVMLLYQAIRGNVTWG